MSIVEIILYSLVAVVGLWFFISLVVLAFMSIGNAKTRRTKDGRDQLR